MANSEPGAPIAKPMNSNRLPVSERLRSGVAIPAHPLALTAQRKLDERRQRALTRYYLASDAGGLAVGVHTTQFQLHDPALGMLRPVLELAAEEIDRAELHERESVVRVAGICGRTPQAVAEAQQARDLGYHYGLVSLSALQGDSIDQLIQHCRAVGEIIGLFGFYLQPAVGGTELPLDFWRKFCEIENAAAIKIAAFDRYRTLTVLRAVAESGREDLVLYTGNDDNIVLDLISPFCFRVGSTTITKRFAGGLLGQWAVWTSRAVELLQECRVSASNGGNVDARMLRLAAELTDANGAVFDAANGFRGCVPGILEVLCRQGLLAGTWCLDPDEVLSPDQSAEIDRVTRAYPHLVDDQFVRERLDEWLRG